MVKKSARRASRAIITAVHEVPIPEQSHQERPEGDVGGEIAKRVVVKCRSRRLVKLINSLNQVQRESVIDIGFGGLLDMKFSHFPIKATSVFLQAFNDGTHMFKASQTKEFLVTKHDVHDCFTLPYGPNEIEIVPTGRSKLSTDEVYKSIKDCWRTRYGVTNVRDPIPLGKVLEDLEADVEGGDDFKRLFVVFSMSSFLCPTSNNGADIKLLKAVEDVAAIKHLDWCSYVLDGIANAGLESRNTPSPRFTLGCIPFIMITYFHRFNFRGEVLPHDLPLVKHWNENKLNQRVSAELLSGSLGRAPWSTVKFPRCLQLIPDISGKSGEEHSVLNAPMLTCHAAGQEMVDELPLYIGNSEDQGHPPAPMKNKYIQIQLPDGVDDDDEIQLKAVDVSLAVFRFR